MVMAVGGMARCLAALMLAALVGGTVATDAAKAQGPDELARLRTEVSRLHSQGKYAEATPIAERFVALARQKHGEEHMEFAGAIAWLAFVYQAQGRLADAEPLYRRSLAITEKALGPEHLDVGIALNNLAGLYLAQRRFPDAEPLYRRSLAITEKTLGSDHPHVGTFLNN